MAIIGNIPYFQTNPNPLSIPGPKFGGAKDVIPYRKFQAKIGSFWKAPCSNRSISMIPWWNI
jgi:hypothetical protein